MSEDAAVHRTVTQTHGVATKKQQYRRFNRTSGWRRWLKIQQPKQHNP